MKLAKLTLSLFLICQSVFGQVFMAKEFSKEIALYRAKKFVIDEVLHASTNPVRFEMDPLAASSSGELTSLVYKCDTENKEGLVLGFFGNSWNESGTFYQAYDFKNLPKDKAIELLNKIEKTLTDNDDYLVEDFESKNVVFKYDDLTILIAPNIGGSIRVFWKTFDADWDMTAFTRTKKRFEKKVN